MENMSENEEKGVWCGGLESSEIEAGVDIFFDKGLIDIGVRFKENGALQRITPEDARYLAKLLTQAADEAKEYGVI